MANHRDWSMHVSGSCRIFEDGPHSGRGVDWSMGVFGMRVRVAMAVIVGGVVSLAPAKTIMVPEHAITIQHAIDTSGAGDTISIAPGVWRETIDLRGRSILLKGRDGADKTILDGTGLGDSVIRCVTAEGPGTVIEGLTITGGSGHEGLSKAGLTLGGGILALGSSPTFRKCVITGNRATLNGGGAYIGASSRIRFDACSFVSNEAEKGGGVLCASSKPVFIQCTFEKNEASYAGGALHASVDSEPVLRSCAMIGNQAAFNGGAVCSMRSAGAVLDTTFTRNRAGYQGGAIYFGFRSTTTADACVFHGPSDDVAGGGHVARVDMRSGSCDLGSGICVTAEQEDCELAGGTYGGDGTSCLPVSKQQLAIREGDFNQDGKIDRSDMAILLLLWR